MTKEKRVGERLGVQIFLTNILWLKIIIKKKQGTIYKVDPSYQWWKKEKKEMIGMIISNSLTLIILGLYINKIS